ncbi:putative nuclease of restriction endonuclease-like (RecB) superfamily [Mucilaginibacter terrae]|jgi:predicted nuclease of restriction endonuclease-like (RecB) superfamily|uniref:Nuclease of restriction endonuclease-like (RecB) superfamily n=1 Tax=Mucilaginibacter terrae TaxID=1955052 RepID=A0ABU3GMK4_9SPHI|nr:putative nuclease of restriction endonuclease-like (RecB) superfamily [Mucilaginibacter terrae]
MLRGASLILHSKISNNMVEQFIELTDQIFWEGYAEQLAQDNPEQFLAELGDFLNTYQY